MKIAPGFMPAKAPSDPSVIGAQIVVIADAGEDEVAALGGVARRRGGRAAMLGDPSRRLGGGAVVNADADGRP